VDFQFEHCIVSNWMSDWLLDLISTDPSTLFAARCLSSWWSNGCLWQDCQPRSNDCMTMNAFSMHTQWLKWFLDTASSNQTARTWAVLLLESKNRVLDGARCQRRSHSEKCGCFGHFGMQKRPFRCQLKRWTHGTRNKFYILIMRPRAFSVVGLSIWNNLPLELNPFASGRSTTNLLSSVVAGNDSE